MDGHLSRVLAVLAPAHEDGGLAYARKNNHATRAKNASKRRGPPHRVEGGGAIVRRLLRRRWASVAAQYRRCLTLPFPQSQSIAHNGHRCPVCAPRKRVLILAVPSPRLRGWPFRFLPLTLRRFFLAACAQPLRWAHGAPSC